MKGIKAMSREKTYRIDKKILSIEMKKKKFNAN